MGTLRAHDIECTLGQHLILRNVSLDLAVPVTVLLGVNGAGKTTLLRVLAKVVRASRGRVEFSRGPGDTGSPDYTVGYLPQAPRGVRGLTAAEYLEYFAFLKGLPRREAATETIRLLDLIGLADVRRTPSSRLSGGMMRRLALGAAIVGSPDVVLLDEPTAGLDPEQRIRMRALIAEVAADSPVLVSTHLAEDTAHLADVVQILHEGRLVRTEQVSSMRGDRGMLDTRLIEDMFLASIRGAAS